MISPVVAAPVYGGSDGTSFVAATVADYGGSDCTSVVTTVDGGSDCTSVVTAEAEAVDGGSDRTSVIAAVDSGSDCSSVVTLAAAVDGGSDGTSVAEAAVDGGSGCTSLYVGDLDLNVTETQLYDLFNQVAQVTNARVCRDFTMKFSLGYGYVNFNNHLDAVNAMETLNHTTLNGKSIRIMFVNRDCDIRKGGQANIFIKNLDGTINNKTLHDIFSSFGRIISCKVAVDKNGQSKGYAFVQYDNNTSAQKAIETLNNMLINEKQVYVGFFIPRQERTSLLKFTNVYIKNLSETTTEEDLKKVFAPFGTITSVVVMKDQDGKSRCFGFVNFECSDSAATAVDKLNGTDLFGEKIVYVGRAQSKEEREVELKAKYAQERYQRFEKSKNANLYLKNIDDDMTQEKLTELFSEYGTITSCKLMVDSKGVSMGWGFVAFSTSDEATKALKLNGKMIGRKPIYVAIAERKDKRKARLEAHFRDFSQSSEIVREYNPIATRFNSQPISGMMSFQNQNACYPFQSLWRGTHPVLNPNFIAPFLLQRQGQFNRFMGVNCGGNPPQMRRQMFYGNRN